MISQLTLETSNDYELPGNGNSSPFAGRINISKKIECVVELCQHFSGGLSELQVTCVITVVCINLHLYLMFM